MAQNHGSVEDEEKQDFYVSLVGEQLRLRGRYFVKFIKIENM